MARKTEKKGLKFERFYTREGKSPFDLFEYDLRSSVIRNPKGDAVFEMYNVEVPKWWSQVATDILAQKYFRKAGVPSRLKKVEEETVPSFLWRSVADTDGLAALRYRPDTLGAPGGPGPLALAFSGPNPMSPGQSAHVRFALEAGLPASHYRLRVFDAAGRVVRDLGEGPVTPGAIVDRSWSGDDVHGRAVTPGLYLMMLDAAGQQRTARVVVLR